MTNQTPQGEAIASTFAPRNNNLSNPKPPRLSNNGLHHTVSDISFELSKEAIDNIKALPSISEVEDAKCERCNMSEECMLEYIECVPGKFSGKWICGLCAEAVKEEMEKDGGKSKDEALSAHMNVCARFNEFGRRIVQGVLGLNLLALGTIKVEGQVKEGLLEVQVAYQLLQRIWLILPSQTKIFWKCF